MASLEDLKLDELAVNFNYTEEQQIFINHFKNVCNGSLPPCFEDADFLSIFMKYVEKEQWQNYVVNTNKFIRQDETADPKYTLMFRRTTLDQQPKPEVFWTNEYGVVYNGLKKEIPAHSEYRILSRIFVTTLDVLNSHKQSVEESNFIDKQYGDGSSDGEIRITSKPFNLKENCLFAVKPLLEQKELNEYLETKNLS